MQEQRIIAKGCMFQRLIRRGLSTEGNLRFQMDWASLYIVESKFIVFALFYFVFEGNLRKDERPWERG